MRKRLAGFLLAAALVGCGPKHASFVKVDNVALGRVVVYRNGVAFYERRGYVRTGIKKPFPYGDPRFGQPRRDDLQFEVLEKKL